MEQSSLGVVGINLANTADFKIGHVSIRSARCEVVNGERVFRLQPRVMQVLVLLHSLNGKVATKEELILHCWEGAAVSDDSITRVISQLRKLAKDLGEGVFSIRTVSKVGYALDLAQNAEGPGDTSTETNDTTPEEPKSKRPMAMLFTVPLVVGAMVLAWWQFARSDDWTIDTVELLEIGPDVQSHPAVSPDEQYVVYSSTRGSQNRDLWLVRSNGGEPNRLTTNPDIDHYPAFSPTGSKLAYVRSTLDDSSVPCRLIIRDMTDRSEEIVWRCKKASFKNSTPAWSLDEKSLYLSEEVSEDQDAVLRLVRFDLETGQSTPLTNPEEGVLGDVDPIISPDGSKILFRRAASYRSGKHYVLDLEDNSLAQLTEEGAFKSFQWTPDGKRIVSLSDDAQAGLTFYSPEGELLEQAPSGLLHSLARMARGGDLFVAETLLQRTVIVHRKGDEDRQVAIAAARHRLPTISRQGKLAFFTTDGDQAVIWLAEGDSEPRRLVELRTIGALSWSPDGTELAYATEDGDLLGIFTLATEEMRTMDWDGGPIGSIAWSPDGSSVIFGARKDEEWRLWQVDQDLASSAQAWSEANWWAVRSNGSAIFATRADQPGIWQMSADGRPAQQVEDSFASGQRIGRTSDRRNGFSVTDTQVFFHRYGERIEDSGFIMSKPINSGGAASERIQLGKNFVDFSTSNDGSVFFTKDTRDFRLAKIRLVER